MSTSQPNQNLRGILLMSAAVLGFALNDVLGKWLMATYSVSQVLVLRSIAALLILAPFIHREGAEHLLRPKRPRLQVARVAAGTIEVACFYWAVSMMPLADTMAFWMATPIFVAVASAWILREKLDRTRFAAVLLGFCGVLLTLGATLDSGWLPTVIAIIGVCVYSAYLLATRALRGTSAITLATYQMAGALLFGLVMAPFTWVPVTWVDGALLMALGVVGVVSHLAVTRSLALAPASVVVVWLDLLRRGADADHAGGRGRDHRRGLLADAAGAEGVWALKRRRAPCGALREVLVQGNRPYASSASLGVASGRGPLSRPLAEASRSTSSITAMSAASPKRMPALSTRV